MASRLLYTQSVLSSINFKGRESTMKKVAYSLKTKPKKSLFLADKKCLGLCLCCKFALACTYDSNPGHPILQCEEFEGMIYTPDQRKKPKKILPLKSRRSPFPSGSPSQYKGLCKTCEERATCTYPKPEGGVWHCEEFQ